MASCTFLVMKRYSSGLYPVDYCKVAGKTNGFFGGFTSDERTDSDGYVELEWTDSDDYLEAIYIKGEKYSGRFEDGGSYRIIIDD